MKALAQTLRTVPLLAALALIGIAVPARGETIEGVAAIVNDEVISNYDVVQRMRFILATAGVRPTPELLVRIQGQALDMLIDEHLQLQEAAKAEFEVPQQDVDDALADIASQNNLTTEEITSQLASAGVDIRTLEDQLRARIAGEVLVSNIFRSRLRVSNDQIEQRLQREAENASKPQYLFSEILLQPPPDASDEEIQAAVDAVMEQLNQGGNFSEVARNLSAAASAIDGGAVDWVRSGELRPEIEAQLSVMQPGDVSPPIRTQLGVFIILLRDKREGEDPERVALMQAVAPLAAGASQDAIRDLESDMRRAARRVNSCDQLSRITDAVSTASIIDLGSIAPSNLAPDIRGVVDTLDVGEVSDPIEAPGGVTVLAVCERSRTAGADLPTREQVEAQLLDQQLALTRRRWLRDLRRDATIETKVGP